MLAAAGDVGQTLGDGFDCGGYRDEWMLRDSCCEGLLGGAGAGIWRMGMSYAVETRTERASERSVSKVQSEQVDSRSYRITPSTPLLTARDMTLRMRISIVQLSIIRSWKGGEERAIRFTW